MSEEGNDDYSDEEFIESVSEEEEEDSPPASPFSSSFSKDIGVVPARAAYSDCTSSPARCDCTETPFPMIRVFYLSRGVGLFTRVIFRGRSGEKCVFRQDRTGLSSLLFSS